MTTNMVIAKSDALCARCFVNQLDVAVDFAQFLIMQGWQAEIIADVKPAECPRLAEEAECADALIKAYDTYTSSLRARTQKGMYRG